MSKRIFKSICLVTTIVLIASLIFIMGSTFEYFADSQKQHIKNQLELVSNGVELSGNEYFETFNIDGVRVTWISENGTVLFDNEKNPSEMENHLERPEIVDAINTGFGESSRYSSTLYTGIIKLTFGFIPPFP